MAHIVEHVFAVIGCVTVIALSVGGFLVAIGAIKFDPDAITVERDDDDKTDRNSPP